MHRVLAGITALVAIFWVASAAAMTVQPVVVDLATSGRQMSGTIRVENNGPNPLPVEVRMVETDFTDDAVRASERATEDVMAFPPQAVIPPGETQVFRVQFVGDPGAESSRHYYAEVAQLPVELPEGQSAIQILYNFQVMVNVASITGGNPAIAILGAEATTNADGKRVAAFTVRNSGKNYGYLSNGRLTFIQRDASGREVFRKTLSGNDVQQMIGFGLIGPERTRRFISPVELPGEGPVEVSFAMERR